MILVFGLSIVCSHLDILVSCFHMLAHEVRNLYQRGHNFCSTFQQGGFTTFYRLSVLVLEPPLWSNRCHQSGAPCQFHPGTKVTKRLVSSKLYVKYIYTYTWLYVYFKCNELKFTASLHQRHSYHLQIRMASHAFRMIPAVRQTRLSSYTPQCKSGIFEWRQLDKRKNARLCQTLHRPLRKLELGGRCMCPPQCHFSRDTMGSTINIWLGLSRDVAIGQNLPGTLEGLNEDVKFQNGIHGQSEATLLTMKAAQPCPWRNQREARTWSPSALHPAQIRVWNQFCGHSKKS